MILASVAGVLAFLCLGGAAVGYVLYDRATTPDRSAPDVVVDNYLRAFLVDRNDIRANLLTCDKAELTQLRNLLSELQRRENDFGVNIRITWRALRIAEGEAITSVTTTLTIASFINGQPRSSRSEAWQFELRDQRDGWRVCGAKRV